MFIPNEMVRFDPTIHVERIESLQGLRAFAAWLVVFHHVHQVFWEFNVSSFGGWILAHQGAVGVDLFFVISGFVMAVTTRSDTPSAVDFLQRRLARIGPAYWFWTLVMAGVLLAIPDLLKDPFRVDPLHFLLSVTFTSGFLSGHFYPVLSVGWSLNYEMLFYGLLSFGLATSQAVRRAHLERWLVPVFILLVVSLYPASLPASTMLTSKLLVTFVMGYLLGLAFLVGYYARGRPLGLLLIGIGLGVILATERIDVLARGLSCTAIVGGCLALEKDFRRLPVLSTLGDWSYSTYLVHVVVLLVFRQCLHLLEWPTMPVWIAASLVVTLLLSWASFRYIEKPGRRYFPRLRLNSNANCLRS